MRTHLQKPSSGHIQSQQSELPLDQLFEQLLCDNGSSSNSPTSVKTPDGSESSEVEMLNSDSIPNYYPHNGDNISNHNFENAIPAMNSNMMFTAQGTFSDQGLLTLCASSPISANT
jgi:hypothetical protein